jgi:hypothetical protein
MPEMPEGSKRNVSTGLTETYRVAAIDNLHSSDNMPEVISDLEAFT